MTERQIGELLLDLALLLLGYGWRLMAFVILMTRMPMEQ